jgi:adenylate cyclase
MRCANCSTENPTRAKFCIECAVPFKRRCQKCGFENPPESRFCAQCAAALGGEAGQPSKAASNSTPSGIRVAVENSETPAIDGERKTVTALFADIKGSTELEQDLDPEEARAIIDPALKLMIAAVQRYDGHVVQSTGDGIFAMFGAPLAHEDHPQRALYAGLRMLEELLRYGSKLQGEGRAPIEIRVGVNTGEVVVRSIATGDGQVEYTPIGHTTNLASRLQSLARTGTVAVSEQTRKMVEGYFQLKPLGPTRIKGVSEPVNVYEVIGLGPLRTRLQRSAGRGMSKFVGRQAEMDSLKRAAQQAKAGRGQIVAAIAEAGVGKSRLFFEFKAVSQSGWMVLEAFSVSHGKASAFLPVIDLLWSYFKITSHDDERTRREKVTGRVLALDRSLEDALPYLYGLLGLTAENNQVADVEAQTRKRRSLDAIKRILLRESLNQPLVVIFEDLHWIDTETQGFLNLLADSIGTARVLLLFNYRPEYRHEWGNKTYYTQLRLDPLGKESADEMLGALLGDGKELEPLKRLIIEKTEGNPFFMEETVQVLLDDGALVRNGSIKLTKPLRELKIPPTVQAILAARIDRLAPDHKDLLQTLAVVGTEFKLGLVRKVLDLQAGAELSSTGRDTTAGRLSREITREVLEEMLSELQLAEFIYEQPASGDVEYIFKHALTHDVAYHSMLNDRRRVLHERIGAALESTYAESLDDHVAELAHHYARGGNAAKAVKYCLHAVRRFTHLGSNGEALAHFETGIAQLYKLPDDDRRAELELDLRNAAGSSLGDTKGYGSFEAEQSAARAMELCRRPGINWEKTWMSLFQIFFVQQLRPDVCKAEAIASELVARAEEQRADGYLAEATNWLAYAKMVSGNFELADQIFDRAWMLLESMNSDHDEQAPKGQFSIQQLGTRQNNRILSGWNLWFRGYPDRALERMNVATTIAQEPRAPKNILADIHGFATYIHELRREPELMRARAETRRELATESGFFTGRALSEIYLGRADAMTEDAEGGIVRMRDHMSELKVTGSEYISDRYFTFIANALSRLRRFDESLRVVEESFPFIERSGQRYYEAELHRLKGEMLLGQDLSNTTRAEQSFRTAIDISRKQHAKSWELRAITSLARLLANQRKRDEAQIMLAEIYNSFTEGFDTPDLKDAEALLEELGGQVSKLNRGRVVDGVPENSKNAGARVKSVLEFWFAPEPGSDVATFLPRWFVPNPEFDRLCSERFLTNYEDAALGRLEDWRNEPRSCLALILLLDQFPRNIFRGTARAFATDAKARELSRHAIACGYDRELSPLMRMFFYLPLEHSENPDDQLESVRLAGGLTAESRIRAEVLESAKQHQETIRRFGRFPGRNHALGRQSTQEEIDFLKNQKRE